MPPVDELFTTSDLRSSPFEAVAPLSANVARNVRALRLARGWSVRQLAEACAKVNMPQLTAASLANIERGQDKAAKRKRREITVDELYVLAAVFKVSPDRLVAAPTCERCHGAPPAGFACLSCGTESKLDGAG